MSRVCGHLSPQQLLATLAHTSCATRDQLTADDFSAHPLVLHARQLSLLSSLSPSPRSITWVEAET